MAEFLNFLLSVVTVLFGSYIVMIFLNRIDFSFTIAMQYNGSKSKQIKDKPNQILKEKTLHLSKNKL